MDARRMALVAGALGVATVSALGARALFTGEIAAAAAAATASPRTLPSGPEVLVATRALPVGTILTPDAFRYQPWPRQLIEKAYYLRGASETASLSGTVVRNAITAGQPITQGALVKPGDRGFLAAALAPGMRAVTVSVSAQSGVAGFVFPGDRVDLLLASQVRGGGEDLPLHASETIVRNLRVLATDQRTDKTTDEQGRTQVAAFSTVTLETTPRIAEKIAVAQSIGQLSLSLRPLADDGAELERAIAAGEIDVPADGDADGERRMMQAVAQRPADTETSFTLGGDVSRFQRRTMPRPATTHAAGTPALAAPQPAVRHAAAQEPGVRVTRGTSAGPLTGGGK